MLTDVSPRRTVFWIYRRRCADTRVLSSHKRCSLSSQRHVDHTNREVETGNFRAGYPVQRVCDCIYSRRPSTRDPARASGQHDCESPLDPLVQ